MESPRCPLSVVIPTHDTQELTLACLGSLFRSAVPGMEVIVVDDASRDGTAEAVRERFPAAIVLRHEAAERFTRAANAGLGRAQGEILLLLNSDTEVEAGRPELPVLHHHGATIGRDPGATRRQQHELLWTDLLRWARKQHGEPWAARAEGALRAGAALRLGARRLASPFVAARRRAAWREDGRALRAALRALGTGRVEPPAHRPD